MMDPWSRFVRAEQEYREAMADLRHADMIPMLHAGLLRPSWRRPALAVLGASNVALSERLLPDLFELAKSGHQLIGEVRRCIRRIPRDHLRTGLEPLVRALIADPESDWEAYRRVAELLRELEFTQQLAILVDAARDSSDPDTREVADDFGA